MNARRPSGVEWGMPVSLLLLLFVLGGAHSPRAALVQPARQPLCEAADRFLTGDRLMVTRIEPDTLDDWRTHKKLVGCRVTAAGGTTRGVQPEAVFFYERVRAVGGWVRTPEPRDSPNEASLRFRTGQVDCLFNVYGPAMLNTEAEDAVDAARPLKTGEVRYHVYAVCVPAMPAAP